MPAITWDMTEIDVPTTAEIVAAIKADPDLGTAGLIADAATAATQATAAASGVASLGSGSGTAFVSYPVLANGNIESLVLGDDYKTANNRHIRWTVPSNVTIASCFMALSQPQATVIITGVPTDAGGGDTNLTFEIDKAQWGALIDGQADLSVEMRDAAGNEITPIHSFVQRRRVRLIRKFT